MQQYQSVDFTANGGIKNMLRSSQVIPSSGLNGYGLSSSKFELPTLNVKEISPKIMNRYRDRRTQILEMGNHLGAAFQTEYQSPLRLRNVKNHLS